MNITRIFHVFDPPKTQTFAKELQGFKMVEADPAKGVAFEGINPRLDDHVWRISLSPKESEILVQALKRP